MKNEIITVAARLLKQHGYDKTTYQMIADILGISKSVITYHFKSKQLMVSSIFEDYVGLIQEYVNANLTDGFNFYLYHCIVHICLYREVMSIGNIKEIFFHKDIFSLWFNGKLDIIENSFRDITTDFKKDFTDDDIHLTAVMNQGAKQSLYYEFLENPGIMSVDKYCYYYVYLLGLLSKLDESTIQKNITRAYEFLSNHNTPVIDLLR